MKFKLIHIRHIYNHPLAKRVRFKSFFRYALFHALHKNDDEVKIPFLNGELIVKKGQGGQTNYFTFLEDYEEMLFLSHYLKPMVCFELIYFQKFLYVLFFQEIMQYHQDLRSDIFS